MCHYFLFKFSQLKESSLSFSSSEKICVSEILLHYGQNNVKYVFAAVSWVTDIGISQDHIVKIIAV